MSLKIVTYPNPLLGKPSLPITEVTDEIRKLAEEMTEAMYKSDGIGIAAPQVGRLIRLVIIDVTGPEKREGKMVLVNPVWTPLPDAGYVESEEGCLSVPDYRSKVRRTARVHVEATDLDGNPVSFDADDILAICVQHEIDHLDGKLFIDRISRLKRHPVQKKNDSLQDLLSHDLVSASLQISAVFLHIPVQMSPSQESLHSQPLYARSDNRTASRKPPHRYF